MIISSFAVIWIILLLGAICKGEKWVIYLVILSYIFQAAAIVVWGDRILTPNTFSCIVYILFRIFQKPDNKFRIPKELFVLGFFLLAVLFSSLIAPLLWNGITYMAATESVVKMKYEGSVSWFSILELFIQYVCILLVHNSNKINMNDVDKVLSITIIIVAIVGIMQYASLLRILPQDNLIIKMVYCSNNNIAYNTLIAKGTRYTSLLSLRMHSTFIEPSYFGGYISIVLFIYLHMTNNKINIIKRITLIIMGVLSFSATAYVGMALAFAIKLFIEKKRKISIKRVLSYMVLFLCAFFIIYKFQLISIINNRIFNKLSSGSAYIRTAWNKSAMEVFVSTLGLGLGHKFRGSSMVFTLLGAYGILGTITYILFIMLLIWGLWENKESVFTKVYYWALLLIIILQFISIGILNYCMFWMMLLMLCIVKGINHEITASDNSSTALL